VVTTISQGVDYHKKTLIDVAGVVADIPCAKIPPETILFGQ